MAHATQPAAVSPAGAPERTVRRLVLCAGAFLVAQTLATDSPSPARGGHKNVHLSGTNRI